MVVQIFTCNNKYYKGTYVNSYHEIHEVTNLSSVNKADHIIDIVDGIIANNILFKPKDDVLDSVIVSCNDPVVLDNVISHYEENPGIVSVMGAETAWS